MKKICLFLTAMAAVFFGEGVNAQIANGLIQVSDASSSYWYYIENGHSSDKPSAGNYINDCDGRYATFITSRGASIPLNSVIKPSGEREEQQWKVVASTITNYYYLVNRKGEYLVYKMGIVDGNEANSYRVTTVKEEASVFKMTPLTSTSKYVIIERSGAASGMKIQATNYGNGNGVTPWRINESATATTGEHATTGFPTSGAPRAWRFAPIAEIDNAYPAIYPTSSSTNQLTDWYYIKSADKTNGTAMKYLAYDAENTGWALAEKATGSAKNQIFAIINSGAVVATNTPTAFVMSGSGKYITPSNNGTSSTTLSASATAGTGWILRHVYAPKATDAIQFVLRTNRGNSPNGNILKNNFTLPAWVNTEETYNNTYAWTFEKFVPSVTVTTDNHINTVTVASSNGTQTTNVPFNVAYGESVTLTYKVTPNYVPVITLNGVPAITGNLAGDTYTVSYPITDNTAIALAAAPPKTVTVSQSGEEAAIITFPTPADTYYVATGAPFALKFTAEGYTPTVTIDGIPYVLSTPVEGVYTVSLPSVDNNMAIAIATVENPVHIEITSKAGITEVSEATQDKRYWNTFEVTFKVANGYHLPVVLVNNKEKVIPTKQGDTYSISYAALKENKNIILTAVAINEVPVSEDTWVNGSTSTENNYKSTRLAVGKGTTSDSYYRRSYLEFEIPEDVRAEGYDLASLKLVVQLAANRTTAFKYVARDVPSTLPNIQNMTWSGNSENRTTPHGRAISSVMQAVTASPAEEETVSIDISEYILSKIGNHSIRIQLANELPAESSDATMYFHSIEGAIAAGDITKAPTLVFKKHLKIDATGTDASKSYSDYNPNIHADIIFHSTDGGTAQLTDAEGVTFTNGVVKVKKTFTPGLWYPMGFPFAIASITKADGTALAIYNGDTNSQIFTESAGSTGDFFVKKYDGVNNKFLFTDAIQANTGYIIQFPSGDFPSEVDVTFTSATVPSISSAPAVGKATTALNNDYTLVVNPHVSNITSINNAIDYYQYNYNNSDQRFNRVSNISLATPLKPFEAIVAIKSGNTAWRSSIGVGDGHYTGLQSIGANDPVVETKYYTLQGLEVKLPTADGFYVVKKTHESQKVAFSKVFFIKH